MNQTQPAHPVANPVPLGLFGFNSVLLASALLFGGAAQLYSATLCAKRQDSFGLLSFAGYGLYWWSLVVIQLSTHWQWAEPVSSSADIAFNLGWAMFSVLLLIASRYLTRLDQAVFVALTFVYLGLAASHYWPQARTVAGVSGIVCALLGGYSALAILLQELTGKASLPLGKNKA